MLLLLLGLVLFLGVHSARIVADGPRRRFIEARGENAWKGVYSIVSLVGLILIGVGYGRASEVPTIVWLPPTWLAHLNWLLTAVAFVLVAAAYVPGNRIRAAVGHPMVLGVKVWAFGHFLVNGALAPMLLFGAFLAWAVADYVSSRRRDRAHGVVRTANGGLVADFATVGVGTLAWAVFAFALHEWLIGVSPFGALVAG